MHSQTLVLLKLSDDVSVMMRITNFSKHMKVLKEVELIKDCGGCSYLINPRAFWKGNPKHEDCTFYIEFGIK